MKPEWLPDWRDPSAYPAPDDLSPDGWAWEFLRRNPRYQRDHQRWLRVVRFFVRKWLLASSTKRKTKKTLQTTNYERLELREFLSENELEKYKRVVNIITRRYCISPTQEFDFIKERTYLNTVGLPSPGDNEAPVVFETSDFLHGNITNLSPLLGLYMWDDYDIIRIERQFEINIAFNLEWPLEPQLNRAKKFLKWRLDFLMEHHGFKQIERTLTADRYPLHLRLLDAEASGAGKDMMAKVLFDDRSNKSPGRSAKQSAINGLRRAKQLRDGEYLFIPIAHHKPERRRAGAGHR